MATLTPMMLYIGDGTQLGEVPTRNLTKEEVDQYGKERLLKSGLYIEVKPVYSSKPTKSAHKADTDIEE